MATLGHAQLVNVSVSGHTGVGITALIQHNATPKTVDPTPFNVTVLGDNFVGYCVDLDNSAQVGGSYQAMRSFIRNTIAPPVGDRLSYLYTAFHNGSLTVDQQSALQMAIWEVRYDTGGAYNLKTGNFIWDNTLGTQNQAILNQANTWLASVPGATLSQFGNAQLYDSQVNSQDIMGPVPEPASLVALGVGAIALLRRRKKA